MRFNVCQMTACVPALNDACTPSVHLLNQTSPRFLYLIIFGITVPFDLQPSPSLCICGCVFKKIQGVSTSVFFLVTWKRIVCCPSLSHRHTFPLFSCRKEKGNKRAHFLYVHGPYSAQWNRKWLAAVKEDMECEGMIKC